VLSDCSGNLNIALERGLAGVTGGVTVVTPRDLGHVLEVNLATFLLQYRSAPNRMMNFYFGDQSARGFAGSQASRFHSTALYVFRVPADGFPSVAVPVWSLAEGRL